MRLPGCEAWRSALNEGQGYFACGWIFSSETQFSTAALLDWVRLIPVDRIKGVMRIPEGTLIINRQRLDLHIETKPLPPLDSRIELIHTASAPWNQFQSQLLNFRLSFQE